MTRARDLEDLQRALTMVVRRIAVPRSHERLLARAGVDIDRVEAVALSRISDAGSMRVTELAGQLGVACSTAGRHAANLETRGLVHRTPDREDRRATVVTPTADGVELIRHVRQVQRELLDEALAEWPDDDLAALAGLLDRLAGDLLVLSEPVASTR